MHSGEDVGAAVVGVRERAKRRTRQAIIEHSLKLFLRQGYDVTTTQEIAAEAGVTQRTLFRYFERKDAILYNAEHDYVLRFEACLDAAIPLHDDPYAAVREAFRGLARYYDHNREVVSQIYAITQQSEPLRVLARAHQSRIDWLAALALDGREAYAARAGAPSLASQIAASMLFGAIRPMFRAWLRGDLPGQVEAYAEIGWARIDPLFQATMRYAKAVTAEYGAVQPQVAGASAS